jgi:hypothetical protein
VTIETWGDWAALVTIVATVQAAMAYVHRLAARSIIDDAIRSLEQRFLPREIAEIQFAALQSKLDALTSRSPQVMDQLQAVVIKLGLMHQELDALKTQLAQRLGDA